MGKIRCSHTNLNSWPRKEITVSKNKYTSQFISVIQESTSMPKKIGEKKLKSSHPTGWGLSNVVSAVGIFMNPLLQEESSIPFSFTVNSP